MNSDRRRDAATLAVGVGGTALGGAIREDAISQAQANAGVKRSRPPGRVMLRRAAGNGPRRMYAAGAALGLASAPAAAVGAYNLTRSDRRRSGPSDPNRSFLKEGVDGATEALRHKAKNATDRKVRNSDRAKAAGVAGATGAAAGFGAHRLMDSRLPKIGSRSRAGIAAAAGVLGAAGSLPISSRTVSRGYKVTPVGVERDERVRKYDLTMSDSRKRALVMGAGSVPIVGDFASAAAAARLAPPGQERAAAVRQYAGSNAGQLAGMAAGAYGASALANSKGRVGASTVRASEAVNSGAARAKSAVGVGGKEKTKPSLATRAAGRSQRFARAAAPLRRRPGVAAAGALLGGFAGSQIGGQSAYSRTLRNERRWKNNVNSSNVRKYELSPAEKQKQARRKRTNANLSMVGAGTGFAGLGLLGASKFRKNPVQAAKLKNAATNTAVLGGGVGAFNSLEWSKIARTQNRAEAPVRKREVDRHDVALGAGALGTSGFLGGYKIRDGLKERVQPARVARQKGKLVRLESERQERIKANREAGAAGFGRRAMDPTLSANASRKLDNADFTERKRAAHRKITNINRQTRQINPRNVHRAKVAAALTGASGLWYGARGQVEKREPLRRQDVDVAAAGALGAGLLYQESSYTLKGQDRANEAKIKNNARHKSIADAHKRRHGIDGGTPAGAKQWKEYFRNYPRDLPGARLKRTLSRTHAGKTGLALTGGVAALGAVGGAEASRRRVEKAFPNGRLVKVTPGAGRAKSFRQSYYRAPRTLGAPPTRVRAGLG